jgi:UDP-GlcNAc:undecaprenyl-phosphate GlcNAc-1-phosphate transferase
MFIGILVPVMLALKPASYESFGISTAFLVIAGVVDDRYNSRTSTRFAVQICAVLVMMLGGDLYLRNIGDPFGSGLFGLGLLAIPISLVIALTVINAFNFIDGIDGLAASMALIALAAGALATGLRAPTVALAAMTCAAILGFLPFNFPAFRNRRLRTFMGDAGSTLLGFIVVWFTITICQGEGRSLSPVAALWFAMMPLSDFFSCVVRRAAKGKLPLHPGREHFHYMLERAGLSGRQVLAVLVGFGVFYAAVGVIAAGLKVPDWVLFAPWFMLLGLQYFIVKRLCVHLRHRRWRASMVTIELMAIPAQAQLDATQLNVHREAA